MTALPPLASSAQVPAEENCVLLVDDYEPCLQLLRALVESAGHRCAIARNGPDALDFCRKRQPVAVVTDLAMPGLDGGRLAHGIKLQYPSVPVLLLTGHDLDGPLIDRLRTTFSAVLPKPVDPERLLRVLAQTLALHA